MCVGIDGRRTRVIRGVRERRFTRTSPRRSPGLTKSGGRLRRESVCLHTTSSKVRWYCSVCTVSLYDRVCVRIPGTDPSSP